MPRGAKGGSLFVRKPRGSKSPLNVLASLSLVSLTLAGIAFIAIPRFNTAVHFLLANKFPCWTDDPTPSFSKGIFKCRHEEKQEIQGGQRLNHTITSRKELMFTGPWTDTSKGKPDYNSPWFYAPSKLSLCWIPKVGCTKSKLAYAHLTGILKEPHIHAHSPPSLELVKYTVDDLNHIFSADDWLNIVVVRDPLERFISGYLDKVWNEGWFNPGRTTVAAKRNYNLTAHSVLKFLGNDHAMSSDHFAPQSAFCGLRSMGSAWNRLVLYSRSGMDAKLSEASDGRLDSVLNGPGDLPSSKPVFSSGTKHETKTSSEYQTLVKELCCTEFGNTVLHEITEFFQEDYDRFPFPTSDGTRTGGTCNAVACSEQSG